MGRRGFLFLLGAGIGLAGLRAVFRGGLPAAGRAAAGSGGPTAGNVSDVTARYWVRGDELAG